MLETSFLVLFTDTDTVLRNVVIPNGKTISRPDVKSERLYFTRCRTYILAKASISDPIIHVKNDE